MKIRNFGFLLLISVSCLFLYPSSSKAATFLKDWMQTTSLPYLVASHTSFENNKKIFVLSGATSSVVTRQSNVDISSDGSLASWKFYEGAPPVYWHSQAVYNNFIYLLGGVTNPPSTPTKLIYRSVISADSLSTWEVIGNIPKELAMGGVIVSGDTLYYAGGHLEDSPAVVNQDIYKTDIDPTTGNLGSWVSGGTLPEPLTGFSMLSDGSKVFLLGGFSSDVTDKAWQGSIDSDGNIGSWVALPNLPQKLNRMHSALMGNKIVIVGGIGPNGFSNKTYVSSADAEENITGWKEDALLPTGICCGAMTTSNGYAYLTGGLASSGYLDTVYFTGLAEVEPTSTPTPSPTLIPSPTPTTIPQKINKVVLVPGMFGSWNFDALMTCNMINNDYRWEMMPIQAPAIYNPIINAFKSEGFTVYPFYYDWRKPVKENALKLDLFIRGIAQPDEKVYLAGHSMGGLVARAYLEKSLNPPVAKFMTIGSPHQGVPDVYGVWSGGEKTNNLLMKIPEAIVLKMCSIKNGGGSNREVIQKYIPSTQNLLATEDYLIDRFTMAYKLVEFMKAKNDWLPTQFPPVGWGIETMTLSGNKHQTVEAIKVKERSKKDIRTGDWEDGVPISKQRTNSGDGTVLLVSSKLPGVDSVVINQDHGGIMNTKQGINSILSFFIEKKTNVKGLDSYAEPESAIVIIGKTSNISLTAPDGSSVTGSSGIVEMINPKKGKLRLKFMPKDKETSISIVQFTKDGRVLWKDYRYEGKTEKQATINYDDVDPQEDAITSKI